MLSTHRLLHDHLDLLQGQGTQGGEKGENCQINPNRLLDFEPKNSRPDEAEIRASSQLPIPALSPYILKQRKGCRS